MHRIALRVEVRPPRYQLLAVHPRTWCTSASAVVPNTHEKGLADEPHISPFVLHCACNKGHFRHLKLLAGI